MKMKQIFISIIVLGVIFGAVLSLSAKGKIGAKEEWDEDEYGPKDMVIWTSPVKGAVFDHKVHTVEVGLDCASCHDETFEMLGGMAEEEDDFTMAAMADGKYCGTCHYEGGFAFSTETRCTSCHIGVRGVKRLEGGGETKPEAASSH